MISCYIVPEIGSFRACQWLATGRRVQAAELTACGVLSATPAGAGASSSASVKQVESPADGAPQDAEALARLIGECAPGAVKETLDLIRHVEACGPGRLGDATNEAQRVFQASLAGSEAQYGIACFLKKEKPDWRRFSNRSNL
jgi:enoyl-CoA hydratase/carnithine racemase